MIFFTTGNGSITNFLRPDEIKVVTTTGRYELPFQDMDERRRSLDAPGWTSSADRCLESVPVTLAEARRSANAPGSPGLHLARLEADERRQLRRVENALEPDGRGR